MSGTVIKKNDSFDLKEKGDDILKNHTFFKDLSELMEDEKFSNFFDKYFTDMNEIKVSLVYMKLYKEFKEKWMELTETELDKRINIYLMWKMMKDRESNKFALHTVLKHLENPGKTDIFSDLKEFMNISNKYLKLNNK